MKLVVGLGNPGKEYENTRHNVGFQTIDKLALKLNCTNFKEKFNGLYAECLYNGDKIILLKPLSYMNLSGEVVRKYFDYYKVNLDDFIVISDDLDLPVGAYKLKQKGSCGGHNGLRNIELHLGTQEYKRIKVGISKSSLADTKDYVLGNFNKEEKDTINKVEDIVVDAIIDSFKLSFLDLMSKYNHK